jgi:hypothetical protein
MLAFAADMYTPEWYAEIEQTYGPRAQQIIHRFDSLWPESVDMSLEYEDDPAEQTEMIVNSGYEWKFAYAQGQPAKVWGDGEIYNFNDGRHPHTNVAYDDLGKTRVEPDWCLSWIQAPPLKDGDQPWIVNVRGGEDISDEEILHALGLEGQARIKRTGEARMGKTDKHSVDWNNDDLDPRLLNSLDGREPWQRLEQQIIQLASQYEANINWLGRGLILDSRNQINYDATEGWDNVKYWSESYFPHITGPRSYMVALHEIGHAAYFKEGYIPDPFNHKDSEEEELWSWHFAIEKCSDTN